MAEVLEVIINATDNTRAAFASLSNNLDRTDSAFSSIGAAALGVGAAIVAAFAAAAAAVAVPTAATMNWANQLHELNLLLGMSAEQAGAFAGAMNFVGLSVEEGTAGLAIFARNIETAKLRMNEASTTFKDNMETLKAGSQEAIDNLNEQWITAQENAAAKSEQIWSDFASKRADIEQALQDRINQMQDANAEKFQNAQAKINLESTRGKEDAQKEMDRKMEDLQLSTAQKLLTATSQSQRDAILLEDQRQRAAILTQFQRKTQDIENTKKRREEDLKTAEREANEAFQKFKAREESKAFVQIERARKAAEKQDEINEKSLNKQHEQYEKHLKKQEESFDRMSKRLEKTLRRAFVSSPFEMALQKLGLSIQDIQDKFGNIDFDKILEAFEKLPEGTARASTALYLFGRGGSKFLEFLNLGAKNIKEFDQKMKDWGLTLTEEQIKAAKGLEYAWNETKLRLQGVLNQVGQELIPVLTYLTKLINTEVMPAFLKWVKEALPQVDKFIKNLGERFRTGGVKGIVDDIQAFLNNLLDQFDKWIKSPSGKTSVSNFTNDLGKSIADSMATFIRVAEEVVKVMDALAERLIKWATSDKGKEFFSTFAHSFVDGFSGELSKEMSGIDFGKMLGDALKTSGMLSMAFPFASFQTMPGEMRVIPGSPSQAVPILAHGGETIGRGRGGLTVNFNAPIYGVDNLDYAMARALDRYERGLG